MLKLWFPLLICAVSEVFCDCGNARISHMMQHGKLQPMYPFEFNEIIRSLLPFVEKINTGLCKKQMLTFLEALGNSSLWAVQMLDAGAKIPEILHGPERHRPGHFDGCIDVVLQKDGLQGKYCLLNVERRERICLRNQYNSEETCSQRVSCRSVGICIPNGCEPKDIENCFEDFCTERVAYRVSVPEGGCTTRQISTEKYPAKILRLTFIGLLVWIIFVTGLDLLQLHWKGLSVVWSWIAELFSCYRSFRRLTKVDEEGWQGLHAAKVIAIFILIIYRRYQMLTDGLLNNQPCIRKVALPSVVDIGPVLDSLIFIYGFQTIEKLNGINTKRECLFLLAKQWIRMMPLYVVFVVFYAEALENIGSGPLWFATIDRESKNCRNYKWINFAFVNNYMAKENQCFYLSWFLAVVAQSLTLTVVFIYLKNRKSYVCLMFYAIIIGTTIVLFFWNDIALAEKNPMCTNEAIANLYIKTHHRISPYFIGVVSALICKWIAQSNTDSTKSQIVLISFVFLAFGLVSVGSMTTSRQSDAISKIISITFNSFFWSLLLGCIVITFSLICSILSADTTRLFWGRSVFVPMSRLSYPVLFVHSVVQLSTIATARTPEYINGPRLVWMGLADMLASYSFALVLHLVIESPTISIIQLAFSARRREIDGKFDDRDSREEGRTKRRMISVTNQGSSEVRLGKL